jgi:hypothetical protein
MTSLKFFFLVNACLTPQSEEGTCMPIQNCPILSNILRKTLTPDDVTLLEASICSFRNKIPWVCCRNENLPSLNTDSFNDTMNMMVSSNCYVNTTSQPVSPTNG